MMVTERSATIFSAVEAAVLIPMPPESADSAPESGASSNGKTAGIRAIPRRIFDKKCV